MHTSPTRLLALLLAASLASSAACSDSRGRGSDDGDDSFLDDQADASGDEDADQVDDGDDGGTGDDDGGADNDASDHEDASTEDVAPDTPEDVTDDAPEDVEGDAPEDVEGDAPEDAPDDVAEDVAADTPEDVADVSVDTDDDGGQQTGACSDPAPAPSFDPERDCATWVEGGLIVSGDDDEDWATLQGAECVRGGVVIEDLTAASIALPSLRHVEGNLLVTSNRSAASIAMPNLATIGGELSLTSSYALTALDLGGLERIGGDLTLERVDGLESLSLPSLTGIGGAVEAGTLADELALTQVTLPALEVVGRRLQIYSSAPLSVDAPALRRVGPSSNPRDLRLSGEEPSRDCYYGCDTSGTLEACLDACGVDTHYNLPALCQVNSLYLQQAAFGRVSIDAGALSEVNTLFVTLSHYGAVDQVDLGALATSGTLYITLPAGEDLALPALQSAQALNLNQLGGLRQFEGTCADEACGGGTLDMGALTQLNGGEVDCLGCTLELDSLQESAGYLQLIGEVRVDAPALRSVAWLELVASPAGLFDDLAAVTSYEQLEISGPDIQDLTVAAPTIDALTLSRTNQEPDTLQSVSLPNLQSASSITIEFSTVATFEAPQLSSLTSLEFNAPRQLTALSLPALTHIDEVDWRNSVGEGSDVVFAHLTSVGELSTYGNTVMPHFEVLERADVIYASSGRDPVTLPALTTVGELNIGVDRSLTPLSAPLLQEVERLSITTTSTSGERQDYDSSQNLPALQRVTGPVLLDNHRKLESLSIPTLTTIEGNLYLRNGSIASVSFAGLEEAFSITVSDNRLLTSLSFPNLSAVNWLTIEDNPLLSTCDMVSLADGLSDPDPDSGRYCVANNDDSCADDCP